jgi:hypothetical protein
MFRHFGSIFASSCALMLACGDGATAGGGTAGEGAGAGAQGGAPGSGASASGAGGVGGAGASGTGGSGAGIPTDGFFAVVHVDRAVEESDDGGFARVRCGLFEDGVAFTGAFESALSFAPSAGVAEAGGELRFEEFGLWEVTCTITVGSETVTASETVAVLNEAINPDVARAASGLSSLERGLYEIAAANGQDDQRLVDAMQVVGQAVDTLDPATFTAMPSALRDVPGGWPTAAELNGAGFTKTADDDLVVQRLDAVRAALTAIDATNASLDPGSLTMADLATVAADTANLEGAVDALLALDLSPHGHIAARDALTIFIRDGLVPSAHSTAVYTDELVRAQAPELFIDGPVFPKFGFLSLALGMFGERSLQMKLVNAIYGDFIAEVDESINTLIAVGLIDYWIPPNPEAPIIEYVYASASIGAACPGYCSSIDGSQWDEDPDSNLVLVIGDGLSSILESLFTACGVGEADTKPEAMWMVFECVSEILEQIEGAQVTPTEITNQSISGTPQNVQIGDFPEACDGSLPSAIALIPINRELGIRGPSYVMNCIPNCNGTGCN